jgi:fructose-specific component phosphotransferase system IIB-like protein
VEVEVEAVEAEVEVEDVVDVEDADVVVTLGDKRVTMVTMTNERNVQGKAAVVEGAERAITTSQRTR